MSRILLLVALPVLGILGGAGAGYVLGPPVAEDAAPSGEHDTAADAPAAAPKPDPSAEDAVAGREYVKLNNQFVVPVVARDRVQALVVMSLSVEILPGASEAVYTQEPKLRDALLQVLFDHANAGGFDGRFTDAGNMEALRTSLAEVARAVTGESVKGILITDIARQDV